jgi:hypothetical protein
MATVIPLLRDRSGFESETMHAGTVAFDEVCRALKVDADVEGRSR